MVISGPLRLLIVERGNKKTQLSAGTSILEKNWQLSFEYTTFIVQEKIVMLVKKKMKSREQIKTYLQAIFNYEPLLPLY